MVYGNFVFRIYRCSDEVKQRMKPYKFSNKKLRDLGLKFTPVNQALYDTVKSLQDKGHLGPAPAYQNEVLQGNGHKTTVSS